MKKRFMCLCILALCLWQTAFAEIEVITASGADSFDTVTVNVTNDGGEGWITVYVYSENGEQLCFMSQERLSQKNVFTYKVSPADPRYDTYTVMASKTIGNEVTTEKKDFRYYTYAEHSAAIQSILSSGLITQENADILSLSIGNGSLYQKLSNKSQVINILKSITDLKPENIVSNFKQSEIKAALASKDKAVLELLVQSYKEELGLATNCGDELEWYKNITDTETFYSLMALKSYADKSAFFEEFKAQCFLSEISNQPFSKMQSFLTSNNNKYSQDGKVLNLALDEMVNTLKTNEKIEKAMYAITDKYFKSLAALKIAFDKAVDDAAIDSGSGGNTGGGGSSSGGSGSTTYTADLAASPSSQATSSTALFDDISLTPWAVNAINKLANDGIINGVGNGKFEPEQPVTREQFAKIAVLAFGLGESEKQAGFQDVAADSWYAPYVNASNEAGIMIGNSSVFGVSEAITRQDIAVVLYRLLVRAGKKPQLANEPIFADGSDIAVYAKDAVSILYSIGLINGVGDNAFAPGRFATRAETAKLVYELNQYIATH